MLYSSRLVSPVDEDTAIGTVLGWQGTDTLVIPRSLSGTVPLKDHVSHWLAKLSLTHH